jgi:16S rRNA (guanine527-N7)-methyltransferase
MSCRRVSGPYGERRLPDRVDSETVCSFFGVSRESCARLETYVALLKRWQERINLVSPGTLGEVWRRHVADGLQLLPHVREDSVLVDLGSGAGIPGLVLALALADRGRVSVWLVESNGKKAAFLRAVLRETGVSAHVLNTRMETVRWQEILPGAQHVLVLARALAPLPRLLELASPLLAAGATALWHKGQDVERELADSTRYWQFRCEMIPSVTDDRGVILKISEARRAVGGRPR